MMNPVDEETALPKKNDKNVPEETASERSSKAYNWKVVLLALGVFVLVGLVVGITVPLVRDGSSDDSSGDSSDNVDTTPTETPPIDDKNSSKIGVEPFSFFGAQPLANFDPQVITSGYASEEELAADLTNAARLLLDRVVGRNIGAPGYAIMGAGGDMGRPEFEPSVPAQPNAPEADFEGLDDGSTNKDTFGDENNDYGTDNQEEGVEEGDKVVANQNVLYTAYGDYVIAWSTANGDQLAQIQLPPNQDTSESGPEEKPEVPPEDVVILDGPPNRRRRRLAKSGQRKLDSIWWWPMKPWVHAMLLLDTKLVVIAGGYGTNYMYSPDHVIDSYMDTKVLIYDVSAVGTTGFDPSAGLEPLETKDLNGVFVSVRAIDSDSGGHNVHVVTSGGISYYEQLIRPFEKWSDTELQEMSDEDYVATVVQRAEEKHIPNFVNQLMNDLRIDGVMPSLTRINSFDDGDGVNLAPWVYPDGYLNTVVQVHSFHVAAGTGARRHLQDTPALTALSVSGTILPTYNPQVYATENIMIIASSGSGYSEARESMVEMTYLMSFLLVGATSEPYTIGSFLGNIINQYSMDVVLYNGVQRVLRMATTLRKAWFWGFPEPLFVDGTAEDSTSASGGGTSDGATGSGGTRRLNTEPEVWEESTTENYVVTIDIDGTDDDNDPTTASVMDLLDIKRIGKEHEEITAVRFYETYAYAVTFMRTDPFYKLDVSDPYDIKVLYEVEITGFSRYLRSIDETDQVILALGQEADENGFILGLTISLFDMRNYPPTVIRHTLEVEPNIWSSSEGLWDEKANRYFNGRFLVPVNMNSYPEEGYFDGFKVFKITAGETLTQDSIQEDTECSVNFWSEINIAVDRYCASLPPRALIFSGSYISMKNHYITRTDLGACGTEWESDIIIDSASCYNF